MYVELGVLGQNVAAYLDQQYPAQKWLPIDSRDLQAFLAAVPTAAKALARRRVAHLASAYQMSA